MLLFCCYTCYCHGVPTVASVLAVLLAPLMLLSCCYMASQLPLASYSCFWHPSSASVPWLPACSLLSLVYCGIWCPSSCWLRILLLDYLNSITISLIFCLLLGYLSFYWRIRKTVSYQIATLNLHIAVQINCLLHWCRSVCFLIDLEDIFVILQHRKSMSKTVLFCLSPPSPPPVS
jgi:hypothetical protein